MEPCYPCQSVSSQRRDAWLISVESPERDTGDPMGRVGESWWTLLVLPLFLGPFYSSFTHLPKGMKSYFVLQVNFKAQSVFKKVPQDTRQHDSSQFSLNFSLCYWVLFTRGACCRVKFRRVLPRPAVLSTNVNDGLTACCQTGNVL